MADSAYQPKIDPTGPPLIMGILNLTPDSFSDGGQNADPAQAVSHALDMAKQGADIIDIGGESTRPGAKRIESREQLARVLPVIEPLAEALSREYPRVRISIDTTRADVAEKALDAGASLLNDVSAATEDPQMLSLAGERGCPIVLMHMRGEPGTMQDNPTYDDVAAEVRDHLQQRAEAGAAAGLGLGQVVLDPGIGFGKTTEHNLALLRALPELVGLGHPVMVGASRKRFIGEFGSGGGVEDRLGGTCVISAHCVQAGVRMLRVHDVGPNRQAVDLAWTLSAGG